MSDLLAIDALRAGYGEAVVLPSMSLTLGEVPQERAARAGAIRLTVEERAPAR